MPNFDVLASPARRWFAALSSVFGPAPARAEDPIEDAAFLDQEPDLAKEAGLRTRQISGWAMGAGAPVPD